MARTISPSIRSAPGRFRFGRLAAKFVHRALDRNATYRDRALRRRASATTTVAGQQPCCARFKGRRKLPMIDRVEVSIIEEGQPRWLSFLNGEFDLIAVPFDFANQAVPGGKLAPWLDQAARSQMDRFLESRPLRCTTSTWTIRSSAAWRRTRWRIAPGDQHSPRMWRSRDRASCPPWPGDPRHSRPIAPGTATATTRAFSSLRHRIFSPGKSQGAAGFVRLRRPRWRRLAGAA